jgi:hypothetical protein
MSPRDSLAVLIPIALAAFAMPPATIPPPLLDRVDHLVYATPDLDRSIAEIEARTGVRASAGGPHVGRGTRNALIALGPNRYLEIIGPDPAQPTPATPRPFGVDALKAPRLLAWAAHGTDLPRLRADAAQKGVPFDEVSAMSRVRPDGVTLSWHMTLPTKAFGDGLVPFFIDWGSTPHPSLTAAQGLTLVALRAEHPAPPAITAALDALGIALPVTPGAVPGLIATIDGPKGRIELK